MPKFLATGRAVVYVLVEVEADDQDQALDKAYEVCGGLTSYAGNGGFGKLVGVLGEGVSIEPDDDGVEYHDVEPVSEGD